MWIHGFKFIFDEFRSNALTLLFDVLIIPSLASGSLLLWFWFLPQTLCHSLSPFLFLAGQKIPLVLIEVFLEWGLPSFITDHQAQDLGASCQQAIHRWHLSLWPHCQGPSQSLEWRSQASTAGSGPTHSRCSGNGCLVNEGTESWSVTPLVCQF